jgi:NAD+ synthase
VKTPAKFTADALAIDAASEAVRIEAAIREGVFRRLRRKGAVVALSGGVDSSVVATLCARALGRERVLGLFMPEADSSPDSIRLGRAIAEDLGIPTVLEDITPVLRAAGCYRRRDAAIQTVIPEYREGWKCKIVLRKSRGSPEYFVYSVVVQSPAGNELCGRLTREAHLGVVAATNFKQRTRKMIEYYHADRLQYAVVGTPNRLEYDQGFFVKNGDGAADLKPIAHLYKSQVYSLAKYLGILEEIIRRPPTTDTYPMEQSQKEFYFELPLEEMDLCLFGWNHAIPAGEVAEAAGLRVEQVERAYSLIERRRAATRYLHSKPLLANEVSEVGS